MESSRGRTFRFDYQSSDSSDERTTELERIVEESPSDFERYESFSKLQLSDEDEYRSAQEESPSRPEPREESPPGEKRKTKAADYRRRQAFDRFITRLFEYNQRTEMASSSNMVIEPTNNEVKEIKMNLPAPFDGNRNEVLNFLQNCDLHLMVN